MLIVEGSRFAISDRMVFFPDEDQVRRLTADLGPLSLVRIRQTDVEVAGPNVIHSSVFRTACLDIAREDDALLAGMSKTSRNEIHKVERLGERMRVLHGGTDLAATFLTMYRSFVRAKGHTHPMSERRLHEYLRVSELWVATVDHEPVCGHLLLVDAEGGRTRFLYEANTRFGGKELARLHSPINRYLHWQSFRHYRERGLRLYDWGGSVTVRAPSPGSSFPWVESCGRTAPTSSLEPWRGLRTGRSRVSGDEGADPERCPLVSSHHGGVAQR